jgi:2-polyprenyl-3-methyl-5-hydroxy-6-metoxy-1,4-benzoquinol methylase
VGEVRGRLQSLLDGFLARSGPIRVLEAGCGSLSHVKLGEESRIVGIDISQQQLERNAVLDERILGDIQTYPLRENDFDVVICWEVLEHVQHPLGCLVQSDPQPKPQGILIWPSRMFSR